jgi:rfaE bifunctional protein nucleotidyltransferase chain/domain
MNKFTSLKQLQKIVSLTKTEGKKIVWTNGCFDILHAGHIDYLEKAKSFGDILIVGLNSDKSVRKLKGNLRPIYSESDRIRILRAIVFIDYIILFNEPRPVKIIQTLQPDFYIKGKDYTLDTLDQTERKIVESYGGKIILLPLVDGISTSIVIDKIKKL